MTCVYNEMHSCTFLTQWLYAMYCRPICVLAVQILGCSKLTCVDQISDLSVFDVRIICNCVSL